MSSVRIVRDSKFRHVFGQPVKKEFWYDGIRITKSNWEGSTYCAVNPKFVAIIVESAGGGAFIVQPLKQTGRIERDCPVVGGHKALVLDIKWCPHHDEVIASCSEDCTVKIWQIPEDGLKSLLTEPIVDLVYHKRRVGLIEWHPTASNILISSGADNKTCLWDVGTGEVLAEIELPHILYSMCFNTIGNKLVTACKDKLVRVHDARTLEVLQKGQAHAGAKAAQAVFLKDNRIFTTGFSKMSVRQYGIWAEEGDNSLSGTEGALTLEEIDSSNGVMYIFYDPDTNIVYLAGKGDSVIRYFEIVDEAPYAYWLSNFTTNIPQRGIGFLPKRAVNVNQCEIARFFRLAQGSGNQGGYCEPISFTVPRKSELYQEDLYPDTFSGEASLTADEWFTDKKDAPPELMNMSEMFHEGGKKKAKVRSSVLTAKKKSTGSAKPMDSVDNAKGDSKSAEVLTNGGAHPAASTVSQEVIEELVNDIRRLKIIIKGHEKRISLLESQQSQPQGSKTERKSSSPEAEIQV